MFRTGKLKLRLQQNVCAAVALVCVSSPQAATVISEVLYDAASSDNGNVFVELFGTPGTVLDGLTLEGVNGSDGSVYRTISLTGVIAASGVFLIMLAADSLTALATGALMAATTVATVPPLSATPIWCAISISRTGQTPWCCGMAVRCLTR